MTSKEFIDKLLVHGYKECGDNRYGKCFGEDMSGLVVVATISEADKMSDPEWIMPSLREFKGGSLADTKPYLNANRLNQAMASKGYFK